MSVRGMVQLHTISMQLEGIFPASVRMRAGATLQGQLSSEFRDVAENAEARAIEEAKNGITVNVVNPSNNDEKELTLAEARRMPDARYPIGRPPTAEDVAAAVKFFASEEAEYVTGQVLNVSGGWLL